MTTHDKPTRIFAPPGGIDPAAIEQFNSAMALETTISGALMPDSHKGYTLPIGSAIMTDGHVFPSWVGFDIGCGMAGGIISGANPSDVRLAADEIHRAITDTIPTGFSGHAERQSVATSPEGLSDPARKVWCEKSPHQIGTLGGGNHFIEVGEFGDDTWVVVHSGSRGFGHSVAGHYMALAAGTDRPTEGNFSFAPDTDEWREYVACHGVATEFARENRATIARNVAALVRAIVAPGSLASIDPLFPVTDCVHNAVLLTPSARQAIHLKGATLASIGQTVLIPANMRDGVVIGHGLGNPDGMWSCSHGAGRLLGRNEARRTIGLDTFRDQMAGISATVCEDTIDESPGAYKPIADVMAAQAELVHQVGIIKPIVNVKSGHSGRGKNRKKQDGEG